MAKIIYTDATQFDLECRMSVDEFKSHCKGGGIISSDGHGYYGTENQVTNIYVDPQDFVEDENLKDFKYVYWYNK